MCGCRTWAIIHLDDCLYHEIFVAGFVSRGMLVAHMVTSCRKGASTIGRWSVRSDVPGRLLLYGSYMGVGWMRRSAILYAGKPEKKHTLRLGCRWQCNIIATSWRSTECADLRFVWLKLSSEHDVTCECLCERWHTERNQNLYLDLQIIVRCTGNCNKMWLETCILKNGVEYSIVNHLNSFKHNCSLMSGVAILVLLRGCVGRSILIMYKITVI